MGNMEIRRLHSHFGYVTMYGYVDSATIAVTQHHVLDGCYETVVFGLISL